MRRRWIVFSNFMDKGVFTYQGGTDHLIKEMKKELLKNGVDIRTHCMVEKIYVEDKAVQGVRVNGQNIACKSVLSNSNIITTIEQLVGKEKFSPEYIKDVKNVRLNNSSCQVYMGIKKGEQIPHVGDLLFSSEAEEYCTEKILSKNVFLSKICVIRSRIRKNKENQPSRKSKKCDFLSKHIKYSHIRKSLLLYLI